MIVKLLNKKLDELINDACSGSESEQFLRYAVTKARQMRNSENAKAHQLADAINSLSVALTAKNVAESCACEPRFYLKVNKAPLRYKVAMSVLDEEQFARCVFCVDPVETGDYGYKTTGLYKEDGQPVAILEKI